MNDFQEQEAYINSDLEITTINSTETEGRSIEYRVCKIVENGFETLDRMEKEFDPYHKYHDGNDHFKMADKYLERIKSKLIASGNYPE